MSKVIGVLSNWGQGMFNASIDWRDVQGISKVLGGISKGLCQTEVC